MTARAGGRSRTPVGGGPRDTVITGQRVAGGAVAEPPHPHHGLPKAGQRPAAARGAAPAAVSRQQLGHELGQFPGDVKRGTTGDRVEPSLEGGLWRDLLLLGSHAHLRAALFVCVSAWICPPGLGKARLSEPNSLRSPQYAAYLGCLRAPGWLTRNNHAGQRPPLGSANHQDGPAGEAYHLVCSTAKDQARQVAAPS
jgi:hypothetical protein